MEHKRRCIAGLYLFGASADPRYALGRYIHSVGQHGIRYVADVYQGDYCRVPVKGA